MRIASWLPTMRIVNHGNRFVFTYNANRQSFRRGMNEATPLQKLRSCNMLYAEQFLKFPVILLEDLVKVWGGTDVSAHYRYNYRRTSRIREQEQYSPRANTWSRITKNVSAE